MQVVYLVYFRLSVIFVMGALPTAPRIPPLPMLGRTAQGDRTIRCSGGQRRDQMGYTRDLAVKCTKYIRTRHPCQEGQLHLSTVDLGVLNLAIRNWPPCMVFFPHLQPNSVCVCENGKPTPTPEKTCESERNTS